MKFFTADLHFGHSNILKFVEGRPGDNPEEMNAILIERWNETVPPHASVYILGDLVMGQFAENVQLLSKLNGSKVLVPGNHDRVHFCYKAKSHKKSEWHLAYVDNGVSILPNLIKVSLSSGIDVEACHFPRTSGQYDDRYADLHPAKSNLPLLHGHVHESWKVLNDDNGLQINVGVDVWDYRPVSELEISELINEQK